VTTSTVVTRVSREGTCLVARCTTCGTALQHVDGFDPDVALGTLFQHHPASPAAVHQSAVPAGWRRRERLGDPSTTHRQQEDA
jgi:hypothetical protein